MALLEDMLEMKARREARASLMAFTTYTYPQYEVAPPHRRIINALEAVERGEIKRLMISVPPRGGKSELVSRRYPAFVLARNPGIEFIGSSYSGDLAIDFGRDVRSIVRSDEFSRLFPNCQINPSSGAAERWETTTGGKYRAVGVEGSITGRGADRFLIDDPVRDRAEADSETRQRRTWDWYRSTAYTRLSKTGAVIVCQTRWNENDLSGLLLEAMAQKGGERWETIIIPALNDDDESFWPERFPTDRLETIRKTLGPREWSALYMQKPQPDEGTFFQRAWFKRYKPDELPSLLRIYMTSDHARTDEKSSESKTKPDFTVIRVWGVDTRGDLWWLGGYRGQVTADIWALQAIMLIRTYKPLCWFAENDTIWGTVAPFVQRLMREERVACRIETLPTKGDKIAKAQSFQAMASSGRVHLPLGEEADNDLDEYIRFPAGRNDDCVDAGSQMGRALMDAHPAIVQFAPPAASRRDAWGNPMRGSGDWRAA